MQPRSSIFVIPPTRPMCLHKIPTRLCFDIFTQKLLLLLLPALIVVGKMRKTFRPNDALLTFRDVSHPQVVPAVCGPAPVLFSFKIP